MFCVNVNIPELCFEMQLCYVEMVRSFIVVLCFVRLIQNSVSLGLIFFSHYQSSTFLSAMPNIPWIMILLWLMGKKLLVLRKLKAFFFCSFWVSLSSWLWSSFSVQVHWSVLSWKLKENLCGYPELSLCKAFFCLTLPCKLKLPYPFLFFQSVASAIVILHLEYPLCVLWPRNSH